MMTTLLALVQIANLINGYNTTELTESTRKLQDKVIYEVKRNVTISSASEGIDIEAGKTGIIYVHSGCTLTVSCSVKAAAIHVPAGAKLVIAGDANSHLVAYGGNAYYGWNGVDGTNASTTWKYKKWSYTGYGGQGGDAGWGAGAAIGGHGGAGGRGGSGANRRETKPFATMPGNPGENGVNGQNGEDMGNVFVSGQITVHAIKGGILGNGKPITANAGRKDESGYWVPFSYHKMNAGGGGGGGGGGDGALTVYAIGGGAPGAGGGGGGGSGAFDSYGGKATQGHGSSGQGGFGGQNGNKSYGLQGHMYQQEPCYHSPSIFSGAGGKGGIIGKPGFDGQLYAQSSANFSKESTYKMTTISALNYPLDLYLRFDNVLKDLPKQPDQKFYYGMTPMQTVTVPPSTDPNYVFAGYYLPNGTKVYDNKGQLTEQGKHVLFSFNDVLLTAYWVGPTHVHLVLKYEQANPSSKKDEYVRYPIDSFFIVMPDEKKHVQWKAKDFLLDNYHTDETKMLSVDLKPNAYYADTFVYTLNRHTIDWVIPQTKGDIYKRVSLRNDKGQQVTQWQESLPVGRLVKEPRLYFQTKDDSLGIQVVGWSKKQERMPAADISGNELILKKVRVKVYVNKNDSGQLIIRNRQGVPVDSCTYGDTLSIQLVPDTGCLPNRPKVCTYVQGTPGDTLPLTKVDDLNYLFRCTNTVMIYPSYRPAQYTASVSYQYEPTTTVKAQTWFVSNRQTTPVKTDTYSYQYNDAVTFASWLDTDTMENWVVIPVVRQPNGDTVPVQWTLTDVFVNRLNQHVWMPSYTYFAPASNVSVEQTAYYRPRKTCAVYNKTQNAHIDSVFVNLNKVTLGPDSTTLVRALDVVSVQMKDGDTAAAKAGYWDEQGKYQSLPLYIEKVEIAGGDFATLFYTLAPEYNMAIGLIDGPKIILQHCDTAVEWIAPSSAMKGDTVFFRLIPRHGHDDVQVDSVLFYDVNSQLIGRFNGDDAWANQFIMPDTSLFVYVYARVKGQYHHVTFLNANGDTLQYRDWYLTGDTVDYYGPTPTLPSDTTQFRWVFQDWTPQLHPVVGNDVYTATYKRHIYLHESKDNSEMVDLCRSERVDVDFFRPMDVEYYYPVVFPFGLNRAEIAQLFGENTMIGKFSSSIQKEDKIYLNFALYEDSLRAGTPYLIKPSSSFIQMTLENKLIENRLDTIRMEHAEFRPIFNPIWLPDRVYNYRFISQNKLYWPKDATGPLRAFRGYFYMLDEEPTPTDVYLVVEGNNSTYTYIDGNGSADPNTGIDNTETALFEVIQTNTTMVQKILYRGQLYIIRNGVIYNALGQRQKLKFIKHEKVFCSSNRDHDCRVTYDRQ